MAKKKKVLKKGKKLSGTKTLRGADKNLLVVIA
jgi:hypothetical protein